jgi:hypothetical protein
MMIYRHIWNTQLDSVDKSTLLAKSADYIRSDTRIVGVCCTSMLGGDQRFSTQASQMINKLYSYK